ncbi:MAG: peptide/nickel transport system permease protein [Actinomycetota bacterium]|nr:peptide/nickel transport system permease protein [Actinomycetota bacterium]
MTTQVGVESAHAAARAGDQLRRAAALLKAVVSTPGGAFGSIVVLALLICVVFGDLITPYSSSQQNITERLQGPSMSHLLGTDSLGRDLLSRTMLGARVALSVAVPAVLLALLVGAALGIVAGYVRGWFDQVAVLIMDTLQVFPVVLLALLVLTLLGQSLGNLVVLVAVAFVPNYGRVARALVLKTKQETYIDAERSLGAGSWRIVSRHLLPNIVAPFGILVAMDIPFAIVAEAGLSFLGLGAQPPTPSWGLILSDGFSTVQTSPWAVIAASAVLGITTVGFTFLAERIRDVIDPRVGRREWRSM